MFEAVLSLRSRVLKALQSMMQYSTEQAYFRKCETRQLLSNDEFYGRFYDGSDIPRLVVERTREVFADQLAMDRVDPRDHLGQIFPDLDFNEVTKEVANAFGIPCPPSNPDGDTFDDVVRWIAKHIPRQEQNTRSQ